MSVSMREYLDDTFSGERIGGVSISSLLGVPLIESKFATTRSVETHRRSWREHLFSRPWHPWKATYTTTREEPAIFRVGNKFIVHPDLMEELRQISREEPSRVSHQGGMS